MQRASYQIALGMVVAAAAIGAAIYARPIADRYTFNVANGQILRFDSTTGEALICNRRRCVEMAADGHRATTVRFAEGTNRQEYSTFTVVSRPGETQRERNAR